VPQVARLGRRDIDRALAFVAEAAASEGAQPFELPVVEMLLEFVRADRAGYYECPYPGERATTVYVQTSDIGSWDPDVAAATRHSWPLRDECSQVATTAVIFSDFLSRRDQRRNLWYQGVMRPHSVEYECKLWLPAPSGAARGFFFSRSPGDRDFDERDRSVLTVLRAHLAAIRERWERRRCPPGLTDRELEVLGLIREGLTNQEIADRLVIATGTVRTHLENIFEKLNVHTRTAALARAFGPKA
jgi:DNA-binding CsgD family transcriptional regulator